MIQTALLTLGCLLLAGCGRNERMDAVYLQRCMSCHGVSGRGDGPVAASLPTAPPDFRQTVERKSNGQIRKVIAEGRGTMPAFDPALRQSKSPICYKMVRFLSREGRDVQWWEKFDTLVAAHCQCSLGGRIGLRSARGRKKAVKGFDAALRGCRIAGFLGVIAPLAFVSPHRTRSNRQAECATHACQPTD